MKRELVFHSKDSVAGELQILHIALACFLCIISGEKN